MRRNRIELTVELTRVAESDSPDRVWANYFHAGRTLSVAAAHRRVPELIDELSVALVGGTVEVVHHWLTGHARLHVGRALFDLLFPDSDRIGEILGALRLDSSVSPARYAFRLRIVTEDERWASLPWSLTTFGYQRLAHADNGWTFEIAVGTRRLAEEVGHRAIPRILVFGSECQVTQAGDHLRRVRGLLTRHHQNYERDHFLTVTRLSSLEKIARGSRRVDIVYLISDVDLDPLPRLRLEDDNETGSISFPDLACMLEPLRPRVVILAGARGAAALPGGAGRQLVQVADAVVVPCNTTSSGQTGVLFEDWFEHHVIGGQSPVDALYSVQPTDTLADVSGPLPVAFTRYGDWISKPLGQLRPDVAVRLDRFNQRAHAARKVKELLFQAPERRLQLLVAAGAPGNAIEELASHLHHDLAMSEPDWQMIRCSIALPYDRTGFEPRGEDWAQRERALALGRLEALLVDALAAGDHIPLLDAIAFAISDALPGKIPLLWIDWGAYGDRRDVTEGTRPGLMHDCPSQTLEVWLDFHRHLALRLERERQINVVSSIGLEKPTDSLPFIEEDIIWFSNAGHAHVAAHMLPPLQRVERHELLEFLRDDPSVGVPRSYLQVITEALLEESRGDYDVLISAIARGEKTGWQAYMKRAAPRRRRKY